MSGGYFEYAQNKICYGILEKAKNNILDKEYYNNFNNQKDAAELCFQVFVALINSYLFSSLAFVHVQRADWFLCGDDSFDSYRKRTIEDLSEADLDIESLLEKGSQNLITHLRNSNITNEKLQEFIKRINNFVNTLTYN